MQRETCRQKPGNARLEGNLRKRQVPLNPLLTQKVGMACLWHKYYSTKALLIIEYKALGVHRSNNGSRSQSTVISTLRSSFCRKIWMKGQSLITICTNQSAAPILFPSFEIYKCTAPAFLWNNCIAFARIVIAYRK